MFHNISIWRLVSYELQDQMGLVELSCMQLEKSVFTTEMFNEHTVKMWT